MSAIKLGPQSVVITAPRELVFQLLTAFRRGRVDGDNTESTRLISEDGDTKIVEFKTKAGLITYTTVEEVTLFKPERIAFRHLEGPLHLSEEEFMLEETPDGGTLLTHSGSFIHLEPVPVLRVVWRHHLHEAYVPPCHSQALRRPSHSASWHLRPGPRAATYSNAGNAMKTETSEPS